MLTLKITLYDLCANDPEVRFGPYCWLTKFALLHKGLEFDTVALGFTEKDNYPDPEYGKLPMLLDNGELVRDSAAIIDHLERRYPGRPLTATESERAAVDFYRAWLGAVLFPALAPLMFAHVVKILRPEDQNYFRKSREARFGGVPLEELALDPLWVTRTEAALLVMAGPLARHDFFGGLTPNLCDYTLLSPLIWQRVVSHDRLYDTPAPVSAWVERMLDLFGGYARGARRAAAA